MIFILKFDKLLYNITHKTNYIKILFIINIIKN